MIDFRRCACGCTPRLTDCKVRMRTKSESSAVVCTHFASCLLAVSIANRTGAAVGQANRVSVGVETDTGGWLVPFLVSALSFKCHAPGIRVGQIAVDISPGQAGLVLRHRQEVANVRIPPSRDGRRSPTQYLTYRTIVGDTRATQDNTPR